MPRYYLHLRDGTDEVLDEEGMECLHLDALKKRCWTALAT